MTNAEFEASKAYQDFLKIYTHPGEYVEPQVDHANFLMTAKETGVSLAQASSFAMGGSTAVGAAVALNIVTTELTTDFLGEATLQNGSAFIAAISASEDETNALATAMGADMERYAKKVKHAEAVAENEINDVTTGAIYDNMGQNQGQGQGQGNNNGTFGNINNKLDKEKSNTDPNDPNGNKPKDNAPLSTNVMKSQNTNQNTDAGGSGTSEGFQEANGQTGQNFGTGINNGGQGQGGDQQGSQKVQVAAAVGLTVSKHKANTKVQGKIKAAGGAQVIASNEGNFRTLGTGAAVSQDRRRHHRR